MNMRSQIIEDILTTKFHMDKTVKGFSLLKSSIIEYINNGKYTDISDQYNMKKSIVEREMRLVINTAWIENHKLNVDGIFKSANIRPSLFKFISAVSEYVINKEK